MGSHLIPYTDAEAIAAAKTDALLLNYTQGARAYHDANQVIPTADWTILALNQERYDTDAIHDLSTNNSRLTCRTAGKYIIVANVRFALHATGMRSAVIYLGGATFIASTTVLPTTGALNQDIITTTIYDLAVNNYVEIRVYQTSGGDLNVLAQANFSPEFMMQRIE